MLITEKIYNKNSIKYQIRYLIMEFYEKYKSVTMITKNYNLNSAHLPKKSV